MRNDHYASDQTAGRPVSWIVTIAALLTMTACSQDKPSGNASPDTSKSTITSESSTSIPAPTGYTLPEDLPEQIPLPDDYLVVRNSSGTSDLTGREIALNIALPGTLEEWTQTYNRALRDAFEVIEFQEERSGPRWRFHGHGFAHAILYLNDNQGYLDRGSTDSTHLPVMLSLMLTERRTE